MQRGREPKKKKKRGGEGEAHTRFFSTLIHGHARSLTPFYAVSCDLLLISPLSYDFFALGSCRIL